MPQPASNLPSSSPKDCSQAKHTITPPPLRQGVRKLTRVILQVVVPSLPLNSRYIGNISRECLKDHSHLNPPALRGKCPKSHDHTPTKQKIMSISTSFQLINIYFSKKQCRRSLHCFRTENSSWCFYPFFTCFSWEPSTPRMSPAQREWFYPEEAQIPPGYCF